MKAHNQRLASAMKAREEIYNSVRRIEAVTLVPSFRGGDDKDHERVSEFNADIATESTFSMPLTDYAVGYSDAADLDAELEFFAPEVPVTPRFEYAVHDNAEAFLSDGDDDERPAKADFKEVEYTESRVNDKTVNRGLQITLDMDKIRGRSDWEEHYTAKLLMRIKRNSLRRAITMLSAAANNTAKTWDASAGKDPDMDVLQELLAGALLSGVKPTRVGFGDTAFTKRLVSHRAQNTNGGSSSAGMSLEEIAAFYGVESVLRSNARYTSSATNRSEILGALVLMFNARSGVDTEDASNIKRFFSNGEAEEGGGRYQVYSQRVSAKRHIIAVGHYERIAITSTLGIRKFTVS
jgi:hypothetical protein